MDYKACRAERMLTAPGGNIEYTPETFPVITDGEVSDKNPINVFICVPFLCSRGTLKHTPLRVSGDQGEKEICRLQILVTFVGSTGIFRP